LAGPMQWLAEPRQWLAGPRQWPIQQLILPKATCPDFDQ